MFYQTTKLKEFSILAKKASQPTILSKTPCWAKISYLITKSKKEHKKEGGGGGVPKVFFCLNEQKQTGRHAAR